MAKSTADYQALAQAKGVEWLSQAVPEHPRGRTVWRCTAGHVYKATFEAMEMGADCPLCVKKNNKEIVEHGYD